ncbi:MAG TPA: hypothetical protein VG405_03715 [Solirubrobacteraceae bacterium]|jgi:hypothetical protein|nr:hypothetical protein [Solirubrobacteraceae bacterium]
MSEHEPHSRPEDPQEDASEREAQAEDPTSPVRGFEDLDEAEAQAGEFEEG